MEQVIEVLTQNQILDQVSVSEHSMLKCDKKVDSEFKVQARSYFDIKCPTSLPKQKVEAAQESLKKLGLQFECSQQIGAGQKMSVYKDFHKVFSEEQSELAHQPGEVLLVDVWATWCGPCQKPMQHNQQMLEKNEENWKGKVRIVAVSVDDEKEVIQTRVNSKGWNKIEHLTLLGWKGEHPLIQDFQIQGIPFVFLVDKDGRINYIGHPSQLNLQERINQLIKSTETLAKKNELTTPPSKQTLIEGLNKNSALKKIFTKELLEPLFGKAQVFQAIGGIQTRIFNGNLQTSKGKLRVSAYEDSPQLIKQFKALLKDIPSESLTIQQNLVKFTEVPDAKNAKCTDCETKLQYPFYWCRWDSDLNPFRCRNCVEKKPNDEGKHYSYGQNSVFLGGQWKRIALKGLGNNIQPKSVEEVESPHAFGCNGCGGCPNQIGQERYVCLGCRNDPDSKGDYIDFCKGCFEGYLSGNEITQQVLRNIGHKANHPILRILYNVQGYYQF